MTFPDSVIRVEQHVSAACIHACYIEDMHISCDIWKSVR